MNEGRKCSMLIKIIFIVIGVMFVIYGAIYGFLHYNAPVNYEGIFRGVVACFIGVSFIVAGNWFISDMYQDVLKARKLNESREQYTYMCDGSPIVYEGFNKLKYNSLEYDLTYDDTSKTATLTKVQTTEQSTILLCCSSILLVASIMLRKVTSDS